MEYFDLMQPGWRETRSINGVEFQVIIETGSPGRPLLILLYRAVAAATAASWQAAGWHRHHYSDCPPAPPPH